MRGVQPTAAMEFQAEAYAMAQAPLEACGVFFYPDRQLIEGPNGRRISGTPQFIALANTSPTPERAFQFDYVTMARNIGIRYWGTPSGSVQLWHSHPDDTGPSPEDHAMADDLERAMADHPLWTVTRTHRLLSLGGPTWWDYTSTVSENLSRT